MVKACLELFPVSYLSFEGVLGLEMYSAHIKWLWVWTSLGWKESLEVI